MKINIDNFIEERSKIVADAVKEKYGEPLSVFENAKIHKYIYERALHDATAFFLSHGDAKFDDGVISFLKRNLEMKLKNPKDAQKLNPEELLANVIKINVIDLLLEKDGIVI